MRLAISMNGEIGVVEGTKDNKYTGRNFFDETRSWSSKNPRFLSKETKNSLLAAQILVEDLQENN